MRANVINNMIKIQRLDTKFYVTKGLDCSIISYIQSTYGKNKILT